MSKYAKAWLGPMIFAVSLVVLFVYLNQNGTLIKLEATVPGYIVAVFPGLLITILSILAINQLGSHNPLSVGGFGATGIGLAILLGEMHTQSIISNSTLLPYTLAQVQSITIIGAILLGAVAYSQGSK